MPDCQSPVVRQTLWLCRWVVSNIIPLMLIFVIGWNAWSTTHHVSLPFHGDVGVRAERVVERLVVVETRLSDLVDGRTGDRWALTKQMAPWVDELHRRNPEIDVPLPSIFQDPK